MWVRHFTILFVVALFFLPQSSWSLDDLLAEESSQQAQIKQPSSAENRTDSAKKYSSRITQTSSGVFGQKTNPKKSVLDFRIEPEGLQASAAGNGKGKTDDDDEKTLSQQVADGKYGLIQNELFPNGAKRPGIISYLPNPEVPKDTKEDFGGLDKDEIWLAEDHVLVLRGGRFPSQVNDSAPSPWPPIDDYIAPTRQVEIPKNPKIPPPFPVQLTEGGPLEFIRGENGSLPPRPSFYPPFPLPPQGENNTFPFPVPPGPLPPFLANLPPGAAFLPPPGNLTDFDEDDPSIYYPPRYDFFYPQDNTTAVPPGPLVPGIVLPPPPDFFAPEKPDDQENETDPEDNTTKPPYVGPAYLPSDRKPTKPRTQTKRPPTEKKTTLTIIYPDHTRPKPTKSPGFTSPIYVPNAGPPVYYHHPSTTPRPNHISIPHNQSLKEDIYIISTEPPDRDNNIEDLLRESKPTKYTTLDDISPEIHPLRTLIKPSVSVSYNGKVGHLPPSTAFPFPRTESTTESYIPQDIPGHFITLPPTVTVTPVPIVKKIRVQPLETSTKNPQATFFFYEEPNPTKPTPSEENEVSVSPLDQFLKENFKERPQYDPVKTPVYLPPKVKTRIQPKPKYVVPLHPTDAYDDPGLLGIHKVSTTPETVIIKKKSTTTVAPPTTPSNDGPFIPSNYYATAEPNAIHFTPIDHTLVDDITMKYFTLFGQKLNSGVGTTPLSPIPPSFTPTTPSPYPTVYTTEQPRYVTISSTQPLPTRSPQVVQITSPKTRHRPPSHFEQYLKEITGEDQNDYIVTKNVGYVSTKPKKGKARPGFNNHPYFIPYKSNEISQYLENIYRPQHASTIRPITNADIQQQYLPEISSTYRPYVNTIPRAPKPPSHNFGQFLQEVTYSGPKGPAVSNLQFYDASSHSSVRQHYQSNKQKPAALHSDVLVNFRDPLPPINPDAEIIPPYSSSHSNIKVVQPPNLSGNRNHQQYRPIYQSPNKQLYQPPTKSFFESLPHSGYFGPQQPNSASAFVSYNLPGSGGHFYFLTPQAANRNDGDDDILPERNGYGAVKRSYDPERLQQQRGKGRNDRLTNEQHRSGSGSTSQDYLRRRRKKP